MIRQAIVIADLVVSMVSLTLHLQTAREQAQQSNQPQLKTVATFQTEQPTGVAVSEQGRVFVNFPLWSDDHKHSVVEVMKDGTMKPYPDEKWNSWKPGAADIAPGQAFVCAQSVYVDDQNTLWVVDPAAPKMAEVVAGGPKLVKINLDSNKVERIYSFDQNIAPARSYLNDVRVDTNENFAYLTDSGLGAIIVVNLENGQAQRVLTDHPSTKAEPNVTITVEGKTLRDSSGQTPQFHADGIALSKDRKHLYYHALTGKTLYRVPTEILREGSGSEMLGERVERVGETVVTDGLWVDDAGNVYHSALEQNAVVRWTPQNTLETVVQGEQLKWPDTFAWHDGRMYVTTSQIHHMPRFNDGASTRTEPYHVFSFPLSESARADAN